MAGELCLQFDRNFPSCALGPNRPINSRALPTKLTILQCQYHSEIRRRSLYRKIVRTFNRDFRHSRFDRLNVRGIPLHKCGEITSSLDTTTAVHNHNRSRLERQKPMQSNRGIDYARPWKVRPASKFC
jgi:hypothetical protein